MKINLDNRKLRVRARHYLSGDGQGVVQKWTIEVNLCRNSWLPLHDERGEIRMDSEQEATARMSRIRLKENEAQ